MRIAPIAAALLGAAQPALALTLSSHDLSPGAAMPAAHVYPRCGGQNVSPDLAWSGAPAATRSFVLTLIDMDVKSSLWSHWLVVDLPASANSLPQGVKTLPPGAKGVVSNFGAATYNGPCPPPGTGVHHYQVTIWAMPTANTAIAADQKADEVIARLTAASLAHASLTASVAAAN
jgi:Raf kinase inhibitor-like YbhB/YbcL family protein